jgi:hypothetical protein
MKSQVHIPRLHLLWLAVALVAGLALTLTVMSAVALSASPEGPEEVPGWIEGTLYEPYGMTPSGGWIHIEDVGGQPWMGTDADPVSGYFSIVNLPPGMYIVRAFPPPGSPFAGSLPVEVEVFSGQMTPVDLFLTEVRISGYVRDCEAIPEKRIEGATVAAHRDGFWVEDATNANGEFKLGGVMTNTPYILQAFPPPESEYVPQEPITVVPISNSVILEMCIPPINVAGSVHDYTGAPVPGAGVVVYHEDFWRETGADEFGNFLFRGLPAPEEFWIQAGPPWGVQGLLPSDRFTIVVPTPPLSVTVVLTLPQSFKTVTGQVLNAATSAGVPDAMVTAHRLDEAGYVDTPTDPTGAFTLSLASGEWHLGAEPLPLPPPAPPAEWVFPGPPAWVVFTPPITATETKTATLKVIPTNAWVEGRIVCPDGAPCDGDPPYEDIVPEDVWVELRSDDISNSAHPNNLYEFIIPIPDGWYELVVHLGARWLQGPEPVPIFVGPGGTYNAGDIHLLLKDATIEGRVTNKTGAGVLGVPVVGWQPDGIGRGRAETDASGFYTMPVIGGEWFVEPQPRPEQPYVFNQHPRLARVAPGGTMTGVDFELADGGSRIEGRAVDQNDEPIWGLDGWAWAELIVPPPDDPVFYSDAPMWDARFELKVRGDAAYWVGVDVPPHAHFVSGSAGPVPVPPAGHVPIAVSLPHKNAAMEGALVIAGTSNRAHGVWAEVFGEDEGGHWVVTGVDPDNAWYELGVISGTWHLRAWVDPASGYVAIPTTTVVTVQSEQVASPVDFEVWPINSLIGGHVRKPDGTPLPGAFVFAEGESPFVGHFETHAESGPDGAFELLVPEGGYVVGAALPGDELEKLGWLNPRPIDVPWVSAGSPAIPVDLRFRELDGEIHGTIRFAPGIVATPTHSAYVWGWTNTGEWAETEAMTSSINTFTYTLRVVSDTVWHVGAVYEDRENGVFYESPEANVLVPPTPPVGQATQDLEMGGPWPLPQPFIVSFDGTYMQTIVLPDGVELRIPPGALVDSGTVTLFIFPTHELRPEPGREIIGVGYEIWAVDQNGKEITQFRKKVVMTFSYPDDAVLAMHGISEHLLVPVYYSTLVGHWMLADSYVVDTVHNEITLQLDHFSKFSVMSTGPAEKRVYLPLILKSLGG